jgi:hypothetical protein
MELTWIQAELLARLRSAVKEKQNRRIVYCAECLGYLPFVFYHWIEAEGQDFSRSFPSDWCLDWSQTDMEALAKAGLLVKVDEWRNPSDEFDTKITYEVPFD